MRKIFERKDKNNFCLEDFLGRKQIVVNNIEIEKSINGKIVLVTGGGGSIGSELCRQIASLNPKMLIIFDIYENNVFDIEQQLIMNYPKLNLKVFIGSVQEYDRVEKIFKDFRPQMVFHAAAHKHVPLMEYSPNEAIKNNCFGTLNMCKLSNIYQVDKFVLVSTDKAVHPINVMGESKKICEMIIKSYADLSKKTIYSAVRFGNVFGSNGSVLPLFLKQIDAGGPVTVTDKEATRFFMTISEAVSLLLQAGCYAEGGEIFALDMGKSVNIYELAKKLIKYKGFEPDEDIKIKITGLRPGEKLYEDGVVEKEHLKSTSNKYINIVKSSVISKSFLSDLDKLITSAYNNDDHIKDKIIQFLNNYKIDV